MSESQLELTKKTTERMLDGRFKYNAKELADIVIQDNTYPDDCDKEHPKRIISSRMIVEDFGGVSAICGSLDTDQRGGIPNTEAELTERRRVYGKNSFPPPKIKTIYELIMENFEDQINVILLVAAIVSILIGLL